MQLHYSFNGYSRPSCWCSQFVSKLPVIEKNYTAGQNFVDNDILTPAQASSRRSPQSSSVSSSSFSSSAFSWHAAVRQSSALWSSQSQVPSLHHKKKKKNWWGLGTWNWPVELCRQQYPFSFSSSPSSFLVLVGIVLPLSIVLLGVVLLLLVGIYHLLLTRRCTCAVCALSGPWCAGVEIFYLFFFFFVYNNSAWTYMQGYIQ